jgi:outer membrane protein TolC
MKRVLLFILLVVSYPLFAQDTITLTYCYQQAEKNYPLSRQMDLLNQSNGLKISNLNKNYLPQMNLNGSVSLQSEVTQFAIPRIAGLPPIESPTISKDWYKLTLDVNQSIYEGNITSYQKKIENSSLQADQKSLQVELYKLKDRINQIYLTIFLLQESESLLKTNQDRLNSKLKEVRSAVNNGVQLASNADALEAELIRIDQQLIENRIDRTTSFKMLSELTSTAISETSVLILPVMTISSYPFENKRFENELFDIQQTKIGLMKNMVTTRWNPKFFAFGQLGYGRPSLNMLSNDFTPWWLFGAKLTWNFFNWNQNKNDKKIFDIQNDIVRAQQETFDKNLKISTEKEISEIMKLSEILAKDEDIIVLRTRISKSASSQLDNGVITSSDYITRLNEETQSKLNLELHKIQLVKAKLSYLYILGKL